MASIVEILAKFINEASPGIKQVAGDVDDLENKGRSAKESSDELGSSLSETERTALAAGLGLGVAAAAVAFLKSTIDAYGESEVVAAQVNAVLQSTGGIAGVTAEEVDNLADRLSKLSGVDDEVIARGEAVLLTFTKIGGDVFPQATEAALNMSMAMGTDLQSSIIQVGKALNDPIEGASALRRVGVQLTDQQEEQIKAFMAVNDVASAQKIILDELAVEFGGVAEMMGNTVVGSANKLDVAWGNLLETMGEGNADAFRNFNESATVALEHYTDMQKATVLANKAMDEGVLTYAEWTSVSMEALFTGKTFAEVVAEIETRLYGTDNAVQTYLASEREYVAITDTASVSTETLAISMDAVKAGINGVIGEASDRYVEKMDTLTRQHDELLVKQQDLIAQGWDPTSEKVQDLTQKIADNETAQRSAAEAMQEAIDKMVFQQAAAGLDADAQLELARAMGMIDEESYAAARAIQALRKDLDDGKITSEQYASKVADLRDRIGELKDKNVTITLTTIQRGFGNVGGFSNAFGGYAEGTKGWETVPAGYPNDSYPIFLTSGERFAVVPPGGASPGMDSGGMMGGGSYQPISVHLEINSPITVLDEQNAQSTLLPFIIEGIRQAKATGALDND